MSDEDLRESIRKLYRIISEPSWQVQRRTDGGDWITSWYCGSEERAKIMLEKCIDRTIVHMKMTPEERMASILRSPAPPSPVKESAG